MKSTYTTNIGGFERKTKIKIICMHTHKIPAGKLSPNKPTIISIGFTVPIACRSPILLIYHRLFCLRAPLFVLPLPTAPRRYSGLASIAAAYLMHNMNLWISSAFNISTEFQYIHLIDMGQGRWGWHERSAARRGVGVEEKIINTKDANRVIHIMAINIDLLLWCQMHELWCTNMWIFNPGITEYKIPVYLCMNNHFISWNNRSDRVCLREREREREKAFAK